MMTKKSKAKELGAKFPPNVIFGVGEQDGKRVGSFEIGDYYDETEPYSTKGCAILELCGCLMNLKLKAEKAIDELTELLRESE